MRMAVTFSMTEMGAGMSLNWLEQFLKMVLTTLSSYHELRKLPFMFQDSLCRKWVTKHLISVPTPLEGYCAAAYLENRKEGSNPKSARLVTFKAPVWRGATGAPCAAERLHEKSEGVLADNTFDK